MKRGLSIILLFLLPLIMVAQQEEGMSKRIYHINEAQVYADRPMKEIGVQKTSLDSIKLKENIALSIADVLTFNSSIFVKNYGKTER